MHFRSVVQRGIAAILTALVLLLGAPVAQAAPAVVINEVDAVYPGDAPDTVGDAQSAPVMEPGEYGTTLVSQNDREVVYQGPLFVNTRDADVYKITVLPGVLATFTVTPHNGQDIFVRMYNADGREVADHHYNAGNRRAAGFAETVQYLRGVHLSREEDGEATVYILVKLNGGKTGRYSINYEESNANDATWTTDASDHLLRAPRVGWGQRYEGYLGYGDKVDCFQLDVATAIGRKVTIGVKPLDTELDTLLTRSGGRTMASYWTADGNPLHLFTSSVVRIGAREYRREEIVKASTDGGKGFADDQTVYPYYAKSGNSGSDFAYVCVRLKSGAGRYEFTLAHEDAPLAAVSPTDADKTGVVLPPGAPVAPTPPPIRAKKMPATPLVVNIPTPGAGGNGAKPLRSIRIGDPVPEEQRNAAKEKKAAETFKKIYRRAPDTSKAADRTAVDTIAYQLKEKKKDIRAEKLAIAKFHATFKRTPKGEQDWAIIRAIAYSKVKK
jgi:hypothetical protein